MRLWWLSTENLAREPDEVTAVLSVIEEKVSEWLQEGLTERLGMRIRPIGKLELLPTSTLELLQHAEGATRDHHSMLGERRGRVWWAAGNHRRRRELSLR